jgi:hypothetical protein
MGTTNRWIAYTSTWTALLCATLLGSCHGVSGEVTKEDLRTALGNATYRCPVQVNDAGGTIFEGGFTLRAGKYEAPPDPPDSNSRDSATLDKDLFASGDLQGDGKLDAVAVIWESGGGTGTYGLVYVVDDVLGSRRCTHTIYLGDRVNILRVDVVPPGGVLVEFKTHAPDQGMADPPALSVARKFLLTAQSVSALDRQDDGSWKPYRSTDWHVALVSPQGVAKPEPEHPARTEQRPKPSAPGMRQPTLVANDFPAPPGSRALHATAYTAIRAPSGLIGDTGDAIISFVGYHGLNSYMKNLRVYARVDGRLEIRFNIVPDPDGNFIWPPQIFVHLLVRLFDQNGVYLTHFLTSESFAPTESVVHELTTEPMLLLNHSPVLLMDSDGKANVLVYTVATRDLDYTRAAEVGFYVQPAQ